MGSQPLRRSRSERTLPSQSGGVLQRASEQRDARQARQHSIWDMTGEERLAAFREGQLTLGQCLEWSRRAQREVPKAPDGEFLYIACRTPEWLGE